MVYTFFLYFFIYSVLGWTVETIYCRILDGKWTNRGFMTGPYCPIYGFGSLLIIYFLNIFKEYPIAVFFLGMLFTSVLEYITSFVLEKMFNAKWWDYTYRKFNINGRVCLLNSTEFAILGLLLTYLVHPFISTRIEYIPSNILPYISIGIFAIMLVDCTSTIFTLLNLKEKLVILKDFSDKFKLENNDEKKEKDFTLLNNFEDFKKKFVTKRNFQVERILNAFPNFEFSDFKKQLEELKEDFKQLREEQKKKRLEKVDRKANGKLEKEQKNIKE